MPPTSESVVNKIGTATYFLRDCVSGGSLVEDRRLVYVDEEEAHRKVVEETTALWKRAGAIS